MDKINFVENYYYTETHLPDEFYKKVVELENALYNHCNSKIIEELAEIYKVKLFLLLVRRRIF
jgi:hypothetical protein